MLRNSTLIHKWRRESWGDCMNTVSPQNTHFYSPMKSRWFSGVTCIALSFIIVSLQTILATLSTGFWLCGVWLCGDTQSYSHQCGIVPCFIQHLPQTSGRDRILSRPGDQSQVSSWCRELGVQCSVWPSCDPVPSRTSSSTTTFQCEKMYMYYAFECTHIIIQLQKLMLTIVDIQ